MPDLDDKSQVTPKVESSGVRYYFNGGLSLHGVCAVDEVRLLRILRSVFKVDAVSRNDWIEFSGDSQAVEQACRLMASAEKFYVLRGRALDLTDFEILCRNVANGVVPDLENFWKRRIRVGGRRGEIVPRSLSQLEYVTKMRDCDVVFGVGPAGTGKTYLAMAMAVSEYLERKVSRIVLTRPARESGERLGFLPGTLEDKVSPYLRPLYDALFDMMEQEEARLLIDKGIIEVAPLAFMRGRTLNNSFIILDEAQNATADQMLMFLTRLGFGSRCVICGDPSQSDLSAGESSGLQRALDRLQKISGIGMVRFNVGDVVRHSLLEKIITAYGTPSNWENSNRKTVKDC